MAQSHLSFNMVAEPCGSGASHRMPLGGGSPDETSRVAKLIPRERSFAATAEFSVEKRNLLSVAYRSAVCFGLAAGRIVTGVEQEDSAEASEQQAAFVREFVIKVEDELQKFRDGILALMDKNLVSSASTGESKMSYYAMVGDYYRYLVELAAVEAKSKTRGVRRNHEDHREVHRRGCGHAGGVAEADAEDAEDRRGSTGAVHRQDHRCVCRDAMWCSHHSNCTENCGSAADSVPGSTGVRAADHGRNCGGYPIDAARANSGARCQRDRRSHSF